MIGGNAIFLWVSYTSKLSTTPPPIIVRGGSVIRVRAHWHHEKLTRERFNKMHMNEGMSW